MISVVDYIRISFLRLGAAGIRLLLAACSSTGADGSLEFSPILLQDFEHELSRCGVELSPIHQKELLSVYGIESGDKSQIVDVAKLTPAVCGELNQYRTLNVLSAFHNCDVEGKSSISVDSLRELAGITPRPDGSEEDWLQQASGFLARHPFVASGDLEPQNVPERWLLGFEGATLFGNDDSAITLNDFCLWYQAVSATIPEDAHFGLLMSSLWGAKPEEMAAAKDSDPIHSEYQDSVPIPSQSQYQQVTPPAVEAANAAAAPADSAKSSKAVGFTVVHSNPAAAGPPTGAPDPQWFTKRVAEMNKARSSTRISRAITGWSGFVPYSNASLGITHGALLKAAATGELKEIGTSFKTDPPSVAATLLSANLQDGAVWDHKYLTTQRAAEIAAKEKLERSAAAANAPRAVVGYTGHIHRSIDSFSACHSAVMKRSDDFLNTQREAALAKTAAARGTQHEVLKHWSAYAVVANKAAKGTIESDWRATYALSLAKRASGPRSAPGVTLLAEQAKHAAEHSALAEHFSEIRESFGVEESSPLKATLPASFSQKYSRDDSAFNKDSNVLDWGTRTRISLPAISSPSKSPRCIPGYSGHVPLAADRLGRTFGKLQVEIDDVRKNRAALAGPPHPLGPKYVRPVSVVVGRQAKSPSS